MPLKNDLKAAGAIVRATGVGTSIFFGTIVPACSLISLIVALFVTPVSKIMGDFLTFYRNATQAMFGPLQAVFNIQVPELLRDLLVFWTVTGAIGAGAFLLLVHSMYKLSMSVVEKKQQPEARQEWIDAGWRAEDFDRELEFAQSIAARSETTKSRRIFAMAIGVITGPLVFIHIWRTCPPVPGARLLNGRAVLILYILGVLGWTVAFFGMSYVGH